MPADCAWTWYLLGNACKERDIAFCVDAIQMLGAFPVDVEAANIDFMMADSHKWLLGPEGIALFYCPKNPAEHDKLVSVWLAYD